MSVLGYVFAVPKQEIFMKRHMGIDITARLLKALKNQSADAEAGEPPYPDEASMTEDEREYCWNYLDHYFVHQCQSNPECVIGYIAEWD